MHVHMETTNWLIWLERTFTGWNSMWFSAFIGVTIHMYATMQTQQLRCNSYFGLFSMAIHLGILGLHKLTYSFHSLL